MLTRHREKHSGNFGILTNILVERLANVVSERNVIFGLATDFTTMTAKAPSRIYEPAVPDSIVRGLHSFAPVLLRLKLVVVNDRTCTGFCDRQGHQRHRSRLEKIASIVFAVCHSSHLGFGQIFQSVNSFA